MVPEGWETRELVELLQCVETGMRPRGGAEEGGVGVPSLGGENIGDSGSVTYRPVRKVPREFFEELGRGILRKFDVLVCKDGAQAGKVGLYQDPPYDEAAVNSHLFILRADQNLDQRYLFYFLLSHRGQAELTARLVGSAQPGLRKTFPKGLTFALPPLPEQKKMAAILSSVDDAIAATRKVIEQTKRVKKGLLQDLMTRGIGHTQFKRTPIGNIPVEWELLPLDKCENLELLELGRGNVISRKDIESTPGDYPVYSSSTENNGEMGRYGRWMFDEELITWSIDGGGDLFYRPKHRFSVTNVAGYLRLLTDDLSYRFLHAALARQHATIKFDYQSKAHPSVIRSWYYVPIPSKQEQRRIGEIIDAVDDSLDNHAIVLQRYKTLKRGLMQDLLTGRVRVPLA